MLKATCIKSAFNLHQVCIKPTDRSKLIQAWKWDKATCINLSISSCTESDLPNLHQACEYQLASGLTFRAWMSLMHTAAGTWWLPTWCRLMKKSGLSQLNEEITVDKLLMPSFVNLMNECWNEWMLEWRNVVYFLILISLRTYNQKHTNM